MNEFITEEEGFEIFEDTRKVAAEVISLKGATVYAPGNAVATMIEAMVKNKKLVIPVSTMLNGEYENWDIYIGLPAIISRNGVEKIIELKLNESEAEIFRKGVVSVREAIKEIAL